MEQTSPISNKMFDSRYSMMNIPGKHVQCPWKLVKSVDTQGNLAYNLVNLYEKGNEKLLEEQFLEENPDISAEELKTINKEVVNEHKERLKKRNSKPESPQPSSDPNTLDLSHLKSESDDSEYGIIRPVGNEWITEKKRVTFQDEKTVETKIVHEDKQEEQHEDKQEDQHEDKEIVQEEDETVNETPDTEQNTILASIQSACSVLSEISKILKNHSSPSEVDQKLQSNIRSIFKKYYQEIVDSHEHSMEYVGYIQDDIRSTRGKKAAFYFNSFSSNMPSYNVSSSKIKLIENSRPLHYREGYTTFLDNFTLLLYGSSKKTFFNALEIDVIFHFFQNNEKLGYTFYSAKDLKFKQAKNDKSTWALSTLTLPIEKAVFANCGSEITMVPTVHIKNKSVHILPIDVSFKLLYSYRLEKDQDFEYLKEAIL